MYALCSRLRRQSVIRYFPDVSGKVSAFVQYRVEFSVIREGMLDFYSVYRRENVALKDAAY